jgi:RNA polymerase sigma-70 factor (ECF subfamily)
VLRWKAEEVAELLDTTVASVNSALQRARATLGAQGLDDTDIVAPRSDDEQELAAKYVDAFERYDIAALTALLHDDATLSMPPYDLWLQGERDIAGWLLGPGAECQGSKMVPIEANGSPAWGQYRPSESGVGHEPWCVMVLETRDGKVSGINSFLDTDRLFPLFGLPPRLD